MKRRRFIKTGITASLIPGWVCSGAIPESVGNNIIENRREVPIVNEADVIVCGGGPAGVAASISSARCGAKTILIELHGCLGGTWTSGLLSWILDNKNKDGLLKQLISDLRERNAVCPIPTGSSLSFDVEEMKLLLDEYCLSSGVEVRLHTRVVGAINDNNRLTHVITESKSGREAWKGKIFIDTTGDGDLATLAGCSYDYGSPADSTAQPFSLLALVGGIHFEDLKDYIRWEGDIRSGSKKRLLGLIEKGGYQPSYKNPGIYPIRDDLFMLMSNHEYGYKSFNADDLTKSTMSARRELHQIIKALKTNGKAWENLRLISTAEQIGTREGRRIHGLYTVTLNDVIEGARHADAACRVTFGIDVHSVTKADEKKQSYSHGYMSKPYDIPLRSLISKEISGLMMAGRCISGDFLAHSSYRVTGNAVQMGEAAGKTAASAALNNVLPQQIIHEKYGV